MPKARFFKTEKVKYKKLPIPKGSVCAICGIKKPLDTCHIIPKRFFIDVKDKGKKYLDYDGENIIILCRNHHALFDWFNLDKKDFMIIWDKIEKILKEVCCNFIGEEMEIYRWKNKKFKNKNEELLDYISKFDIYANNQAKKSI